MFRRIFLEFQKSHNVFALLKRYPLANRIGNFQRARRSTALQKIPSPREGCDRTSNILLGFSLMTLFGLEESRNVEDDIILNIKRSILLMEKEEYNKAEQMLHLSLRLAQQTGNEKAVTYIFDILANMALQREEYEKAEKLFINVMQRLLAGGSAESDIKNVHISLKLARIYHIRGDVEKSDMGFKWSLDHLREVENRPDPNKDLLGLIAMGKSWYAQLLVDTKNYREALTLLSDSCELLKKLGEEYLEDLIICINDMATINEMLENLDKAEELLVEATVLGKNMPKLNNLGAVYVNLGQLYLRKNMLVKARKSCGYGWRLCTDRKNQECKKEAIACLEQLRKLEW